MVKDELIKKIKGKLIVSCQALSDEPLYSSYIMSRMAYAALEGGAVGIRANTIQDISEIKKLVDVPIIGIIKKVYPGDCEDVYITPTILEIDQLVSCGVDIIAMDATRRPRPEGLSLEETFRIAKAKYPKQLFMADCSDLDEGLHADRIGFDFVGTTLSGYTNYTSGRELPDFDLMRKLVKAGCNVIAEGGIWNPEQLKAAMDTGVIAAVVGTAITRPRDITRHFIQAIT